MIPMVDLKKEMDLYKESIYQSVKDVFDSASYILGQKGKELEQRIANYVGASFGAGVANGTDALFLAIKALGIGPGDEVITTPFTFFATGEVIAQAGAIPIFVDIDQSTYNIDPKKIQNAITPKTKAMIVVHLYGQTANMNAIMNIAKENHLKVIEDACQAIGTEYQGKRIGSIGDIGCFSFFPSKSLGAFGDAGMAVTNDRKLYQKLIKLRNHGSQKRYIHTDIGYNSRLDEMQAAILLEKLNYLDEFLVKRRQIANRYTKELKEFVKTPPIIKTREHTFHQYCIETDHRDELSTFLNQSGIATAIYYPIPLHLQEAFKYLRYEQGDLPVTEKISKKILAIPIFPVMTNEQQNDIISTIHNFFRNK